MPRPGRPRKCDPKVDSLDIILVKAILRLRNVRYQNLGSMLKMDPDEQP
jgi:hypothetical protein